MYNILQTIQTIQKLNVIVKPSTKKDKKIDVIKNNAVIASIGAIGYSYYPTYLEMDKDYAVDFFSCIKCLEFLDGFIECVL